MKPSFPWLMQVFCLLSTIAFALASPHHSHAYLAAGWVILSVIWGNSED